MGGIKVTLQIISMKHTPSFCHYLLWFCLAIYGLNICAAAQNDTAPEPFTLVDKTGVNLNSVITSNSITVSGIDAKVLISVTGGKFSINNAAFRTVSTTVSNTNTVKVQGTSSNLYGTTKNVVLKIGGVIDTFSITTKSQKAPSPTTPTITTTQNPFSFITQTDVALNTAISSNTITVSGINVAATISISGGSYAINNGAFTTTAGAINNGDTVTLKIISAPTPSTITKATLTIGNISNTFSVISVKPLVSASGFYLPPASTGNPAFLSEHFSGSQVCANCHDNIIDDTSKDVSIQKDWSSTMMANAARDPLWKAKVRSEILRNPQLIEAISDKCTRCHAPMASFEAKSYNEPKAILAADGGFLNSTHPRHDEAVNGVSCTVCHQIEDAANLGKLSSFTGQYQIANNKLNYGPYTSPNGKFMVSETGFTPLFSVHIKASKLCGTCHNLKTPYVDQFGKVLSKTPESEFPEQMPYSEWENSSYATTTPKSCQQCHMPRANGVEIAKMPLTMPTALTARGNFAVHEFVGANKLMLDIFNNNKTQLGVLATTEDFNETLEKTQTMLNNAANITPLNTHLGSDNHLDFTLKINSATGHKLPSGYPSRRVVVHVTVKDISDNVVFESGKVNANGSIEGLDADTNRATFEPHYELITSPDQVQVYEGIMGNNQNEVTYTLLRSMVYLKDNRILPVGFNKATAPSDIKVVGGALKDANFVGGSDEISYRIANLKGDYYTVEAELVHQPLAYSFAQDLFSDTTDDTDDFKTMFNASKLKTNQITLTRFSVLR